MKMKKNATLRKLGMILAVALLFSALAVPVWADGEGDTPPNPDNTVADNSTEGAQPTEPAAQTPAQQEDTATGDDTSSDSGNTSENDLTITPKTSDMGSGDDKNDGSNSTDGGNSDPGPIPDTLSAGEVYVTGYTVTTSGHPNESGTELQRIETGQKCRILISVADTRFKNFTSKDAIFDYMGLERNQDGSLAEDFVNAKISSTSFASPSLGDIYITREDFSEGALKYTIIMNDIAYVGGENKLSVDISYTRSSLPLVTVSQAISQCADASAEGTKDSALVLTSASYGGGSVEAGQDFTLTVDVLAPDKYAGAENVKVIITPPEQFTSASGSTMVYVGDLKPGATRQVTFQLNASATAQSGSYAIAVNVTGTSMANGAAAPSDQMSVTVPITQPERFEISRTDLPEYLSMGEEGYASVSFVNKGKGTIYNVSAEITGEGITTTEGNLYVGNVASGTESSADFTIQTSQSGTLSAVLTVTYEDEKGNVKELTKDFSMTVEEMNMGGDDMGFDPGFDPMPMPEEPQGMPVWGWILIGVGVLAVGGGAAFVIIKKKKAKKKAAQLTEDDDEDI